MVIILILVSIQKGVADNTTLSAKNVNKFKNLLNVNLYCVIGAEKDDQAYKAKPVKEDDIFLLTSHR